MTAHDYQHVSRSLVPMTPLFLTGEAVVAFEQPRIVYATAHGRADLRLY